MHIWWDEFFSRLWAFPSFWAFLVQQNGKTRSVFGNELILIELI